MTAPIRSQSELLDAIRARRDELNISHETIDNIAGFQAGYTSKLLCTPPMKNPGPMSLGALLGALGMALMPVADQAMIAQVESRWQKRKRPQRLAPLSIPLSIENQVQLRDSEFMKMIGKKGGKRRLKTMKKKARQQAASHAARIRWEKHANG